MLVRSVLGRQFKERKETSLESAFNAFRLRNILQEPLRLQSSIKRGRWKLRMNPESHVVTRSMCENRSNGHDPS